MILDESRNSMFDAWHQDRRNCDPTRRVIPTKALDVGVGDRIVTSGVVTTIVAARGPGEHHERMAFEVRRPDDTAGKNWWGSCSTPGWSKLPVVVTSACETQQEVLQFEIAPPPKQMDEPACGWGQADREMERFTGLLGVVDVARKGLPSLPSFVFASELCEGRHTDPRDPRGYVTTVVRQVLPAGAASAVVDYLHHSDFEALIANTLRDEGYVIEQANGGANDGGADVIATSPAGVRVVIQIKHTTGGRRKVEPRVMREVNGSAKQEHGADVAVVLTNGDFTAPARQFGDKYGIRALNHDALRRWLVQGRSFEQVLAQFGRYAQPVSARLPTSVAAVAGPALD
ncbi:MULTISPECIES: restriction endonuclease [unclassified Kitasatospora]|uniref:restriction endonuclease n=1 Tax=unclassified Kitasatospora TaxID=2633591 RepID=UPI0037F9F1E4